MSRLRRSRPASASRRQARLLGAAFGCVLAAGCGYLALSGWENEPGQWALLCGAVVLGVACAAPFVLRAMGVHRADEILFPKEPQEPLAGTGHRRRPAPWTGPGIVAAVAAALLWGALGFPARHGPLIDGPVTGWRAAGALVCAGVCLVSLGVLFWRRYRRLSDS